MPLVLEALATCGERGEARLVSIAGDAGCEPSLRGRALTLVPMNERRFLAPQLLDDPRADPEMRIFALQVMTRDRHALLAESARRILSAAAAREPGSGTAQERFLELLAVRALDQIGELEAADLLPLLVHAQDVEDAHGDDPMQVRAMIRELVQMKSERAQKVAVKRQIELILDLVVGSGLNALVTEETRGRYALDVLGMLDGVASHRRDEVYKQRVTQSITDLLLGPDASRQPLRVRAEFSPPVPFETEVILALGRTREASAVAALRGLLENRRNVHRGTAILALGIAGHETVARDLCRFLVDEDGFVRTCAYEALRHITGEDHFADWMYGELGERARAAELYFQWTARRG